MSQIDQERQKMEAELIEKAWKDESFRQELISDPKSAVSREFGLNFPDSINLQVVEETADTMYMVIPAAPDASTDRELSDAELEMVAGGSWCGQTCGLVTVEA